MNEHIWQKNCCPSCSKKELMLLSTTSETGYYGIRITDMLKCNACTAIITVHIDTTKKKAGRKK